MQAWLWKTQVFGIDAVDSCYVRLQKSLAGQQAMVFLAAAIYLFIRLGFLDHIVTWLWVTLAVYIVAIIGSHAWLLLHHSHCLLQYIVIVTGPFATCLLFFGYLCDNMYTHGDSFLPCILSPAFYLLVGGDIYRSAAALIFNLFLIAVLYGLFIAHPLGSTPSWCSLGSSMDYSRIVSLLLVLGSQLLLWFGIAQWTLQVRTYARSVEFSQRILGVMARMDLEDIEELLCEYDSEETVENICSLFLILKRLKEFRRFLPDTLFEEEDEGSDTTTTQALPSTNPQPSQPQPPIPFEPSGRRSSITHNPLSPRRRRSVVLPVRIRSSCVEANLPWPMVESRHTSLSSNPATNAPNNPNPAPIVFTSSVNNSPILTAPPPATTFFPLLSQLGSLASSPRSRLTQVATDRVPALKPARLQQNTADSPKIVRLPNVHLDTGLSKKTISVLVANLAGVNRMVCQWGTAVAQPLALAMDVMVTIVKQHRGTVISFAGGNVYAVWNAVSANHAHAVYCCQAALVIKQRLACLDTPFSVRIGIHTDTALVGNLGSSQATSYNVLGSILQLSWLLTRLNVQLETKVILSSTTQQEVADHFVTRGVDFLDFNGIGGEYCHSQAYRGSMEVFELCSEGDQDNEEWMYHLNSRQDTMYDKGWKAFRKSDYAAASTCFKAHLDQQPEDVCAGRLMHLAARLAATSEQYHRTVGAPWACCEGLSAGCGEPLGVTSFISPDDTPRAPRRSLSLLTMEAIPSLRTLPPGAWDPIPGQRHSPSRESGGSRDAGPSMDHCRPLVTPISFAPPLRGIAQLS